MDEVLQNRIDKIQQAAENRANAELQKQIAEKEEREQLYKQIKELAPRIKELVTLANTCKDNGIHLTEYSEYSMYKKPNYFFTDQVNHNVGFCLKEFPISHVGIDNGGYCGEYHLMVDTNGEVKVIKYKEFLERIFVDEENLPTETLEKFVNKFSEFETRFLNWIDNLE